MKIPESLVVLEEKRRNSYVCRLNKSLYMDSNKHQGAGIVNLKSFWKSLISLNPMLRVFQGIFKGCVMGVDVHLVLFVNDGLVASKSSSA